MNLAALVLAFVPQDGLAHPRLPDARSLRVWSERADEFLVRWETAEDGRRAAVRAALEQRAEPGAPLDRRPTLGELSRLVRVLAGEDSEALRNDALARFTDSLDLRLVPTFARVGEADQALTVQAHRFGVDALAGELELALLWVDPGGGEHLARREPFDARLFGGEVPLYVRTPVASAGVWRLVPSVTHAGRTRRGFGVPFVVMPAASAPAPEVRAALAAGATGAREPFLELGPGGEVALAPGIERLSGGVLLAGPPDSARVLVFLPPREEDAAHILVGMLGRRWRALARALGCALASYDPLAEVTPEAFLAALHARGLGQAVLVVRADAVRWLVRPALRDAALTGLVVLGSLERPGAGFPAVPTRMLHVRASTAQDAGEVTHVQVSGPAFLFEPELPAALDAWLRARWP